MAKEHGPGWYRRGDMENAVMFWDGEGWSGEPRPYFVEWAGPSVWTIAGGVFLGSLLTAILGWLVFLAFATARA